MKHKGMLTIEATLIIPIFLLIFIIFIDILYLSFVKTNAQSQIEFSVLIAKDEMGKVKNSEFNNGKTVSNEYDYIENKLKRSIFDEMNTGINSNSFNKRALKELNIALPSKTKGMDYFTTIKKQYFLNQTYKMGYVFNFKCFLNKFYEKNNIKINKLKSQLIFKEHRIFDEIVNIDIIYKIIDDNTNFKEFLNDFVKNIQKLNKFK